QLTVKEYAAEERAEELVDESVAEPALPPQEIERQLFVGGRRLRAFHLPLELGQFPLVDGRPDRSDDRLQSTDEVRPRIDEAVELPRVSDQCAAGEWFQVECRQIEDATPFGVASQVDL